MKQSSRREGIVLRAPTPTNHRISVLDAVAGKLVCFIYEGSYPAGSHIEYVITHRGRSEYLDQIELLDAPLKLAREDLLFVHHVLELSDQFLSISNPAPEVCHLLSHLYRWDVNKYVFTHKLLFLSKLVLVLGLHSDHPDLKPSLLEQLLSFRVDRMPWPELDLDSQKALRVWLVETILSHLPSEQFTTLSFLKGILVSA